MPARRRSVGRRVPLPTLRPVTSGTEPAPPPSSPSSPGGTSLAAKVRENVALFGEYRRGERGRAYLDGVFAELDEYPGVLAHLGAEPLAEATVLEIGFGARPYRLTALLRQGVDATGVDMEVPVLTGSAAEFRRMYATNGLERTAKSLVRHLLFDRSERRDFEGRASARGWDAIVDPGRFVVSDAADLDVAAGSIDLLLSEDVFEHIEVGALRRLVGRMRGWLAPTGVALIRPNLFTGITGGHLIEWDDLAPRPRRSEPWEHLRSRRFAPNSYLNELRLTDYRALFAEHFEILEERVKRPGLGREYLTEEIRSELAAYDEEELLANQVLFVLRPRPA
ncbi:MAG: Methyltransferase [Acidimicrobiales bacterium]|nr:Methyltransferase [Acidimicrobiales bacterium]